MKAKQIYEQQGERTFAVVFDSGDEVIEGLTRFAKEQGLSAARLSAIGAFSRVTLGYFDWERKDYKRIPVNEQVEVIALLGDIARDEHGEPKVHAHLVVGTANGQALGGHLLESQVRPTLEVMLVESPAELRRRTDRETGLALIDLGAP